MIIENHYCINCGDSYSYQRSGHGCHNETNDDEYCPICITAIKKALSLIPIKSEATWIKTDEVDLDTLLEWERAYDEQKNSGGFLIGKRISVGTYNVITGESSKQGYVYGVGDKAGRYYHYSYYESEKDKARITVSVRLQTSTGKILEYLKS